MPKYRVYAGRTIYYAEMYEVEAANKEEARDKVEDGREAKEIFSKPKDGNLDVTDVELISEE